MFTVATGFFDIGREEWRHYTRKLEVYLTYFKNVLSLNVNMVVFTEPKFVELVEEIRNGISSRTIIVPLEISELYMYQHLEKIQEIQNDPEFSVGHPNPLCPEVSKPLYNVVVCNKMDLLFKATELDTKSKYFVWLDGGYTHGNVDMSSLDWKPRSLFEHRDTLSMICLESIEVVGDDPREFFLKYIDVINGGFVGGYRDVVKKVRDLYYDLVVELFEVGLKDDDQFYHTILAKRNPELFNLIRGGWYSAMDFS